MDQAQKAVAWMLVQVVRPFKLWFIRISWTAKCFTVGVFVLVAQHFAGNSWSGQAWRWICAASAVIASESHDVTLSQAARRSTDHAIADISADLNARLTNFLNKPDYAPGSEPMNPWALSQIAIALDGLASDEGHPYLGETVKDRIAKYCLDHYDSALRGWREWDTDTQMHVAASAWTISCLSSIGAEVPFPAIDHLLTLQHDSEGYWAAYAGGDSASTYSTAWCILALLAYHHSDNAALDSLARVDASIELARAWLLSARLPGDAPLWSKYPNIRNQMGDASVSGLAIYTLMLSAPFRDAGQDDALSVAWSSQLASPPRPDQVSMTGVYLDGGQLDHTRHVDFPWLLMSAHSVGRNLSLWNRIGLQHWLDAALANREDHIVRNMRGDLWIRAETLIALRTVRGERLAWVPCAEVRR